MGQLLSQSGTCLRIEHFEVETQIVTEQRPSLIIETKDRRKYDAMQMDIGIGRLTANRSGCNVLENGDGRTSNPLFSEAASFVPQSCFGISVLGGGQGEFD